MEIIQIDLMRVSHVIANQEHQKAVMEVEEFKKNKQNFEAHYSTTAVITAANQQTGQMQTTIITTVLCIWDDTLENYRTFQNRLQLMNGKLS
jgi:hypothetical protein